MRNEIIFTVLISSLSLGGCVIKSHCGEEPTLSKILEDSRNSIEGPYSVVELEVSKMIEIRETGEIKPFGYSNKKWEELKSKMKNGDKIYFLTHSDDGYRHTGYLLVRNGCSLYFILSSVT
jgi:hypothetical protein